MAEDGSAAGPDLETPQLSLYVGHVLDRLRDIPADSIDCVVTSPPYWGLRAYGTASQIWGGDPLCAHVWEMLPPRRRRTPNDAPNSPVQQGNRGTFHELPDTPLCTRCGAWRGELGLEPSPELFVDHIVEIFREVRRVLRRHGTVWLNIGDSFIASSKGPGGDDKSGLNPSGVKHQRKRPVNVTKRATLLKPKDMAGMPWRTALALQADGWWLRSDIVWSKPNPMPESVGDRPTRSHEYVFLLTKAPRYYYDAEAIAEPLVDATIRRLFQPSFDQQTGGPKDYGPDSNRSARKAVENLAHRVKNDRLNGAPAPAPQPELDASGYSPSIGRNARSVWTIPTQPYPEAHFATFPEELPRRCILAGSPMQICMKCGKPRERVVVATGGTIGESWHNHEDDLSRGQRGGDNGSNKAAEAYGTYERASKGFTDCGHDAYVPGTVLDPFAGSGTTLAVANALGRRAVGVELQGEYVDLIRDRCAAVQMADWNAGEPIRLRDRPEIRGGGVLDPSKAHASLFGE